MRITQLTRENVRMQGAERRSWYQRHSPTHLQATAGLLTTALAAFEVGTPKRAIVLGAGACTEVPLERLASFCDSVVLVDVDLPGMLRACNELPASLHDRVRVVVADITGGVSATLASELRNQPWDDLTMLTGPGGVAPLDAASGCLERSIIPSPPFLPELAVADGYGIVISSLVVTQLFSLPLLDVLDTLMYYASGIADLREAHPRYQAAAEKFRHRVALAHLALLDQLLAPQGIGLFTSDITGYLLLPQCGPDASRGSVQHEALPVLSPDVLSIPGDFEQRFKLHGSPHYWQWLVSTADATHPGRAYDVCGLTFGHL